MKKTRAGATIVGAALLLLISPVLTGAQTISLPPPDLEGELTLEAAIYRRSSVRSFSDRPPELSQLGQLLWAADGSTVDGLSGPTRAAPSAGGLYPIRVYIVVGTARGLEPGVYRYLWREHELEMIRGGDLRGRLRLAALGQSPVAEAPCTVVLAADYDVTRARYGSRGAERYVHMDIGHAAQNLALQAQALGLGLVPIGAFSDVAVRQLLRMESTPLYLMPLGYPKD